MTIQITKPEIEDLLERRLQSGKFRDAEDAIFQALKATEPAVEAAQADRSAAIERLKVFGKTHGLSLGGMTLRKLRDGRTLR